MTKENMNKAEDNGVSLFSRSAELLGEDPLEEIFAKFIKSPFLFLKSKEIFMLILLYPNMPEK